MLKKHYLGDQSMTIDVDAYVDHFYIHYKTETAKSLIPGAIGYFDAKRNETLAKMPEQAIEDQLNAALTKMDGQTASAQSVKKILDNLDQGSLLDETLELIAQKMNTSIETVYANAINGQDYTSAVSTVQSKFNSSLSSGPMTKEAGLEFFDYIEKALNLIGENMSSAQLSSFRALQQVFTGQASWSNELVAVSKDSVSIAADVLRYLNSAAEKLTTTGGVSKASFSSTISNIFSRAIGEELARQMVQTALWDIEQEADRIMDGLVTSSGGKLKWAGGQSDVRASGTNKTSQNRTAKVDLLTNNVFGLSTTVNGSNITIEVAANTSVKWQQKTSRAIHIVSRMPLASILGSESANGQHYAYNIIAHRLSPNGPNGNFYQAYNSIRASVAGSFFTQWLTGSGNALTQAGGIDRAQFLMCNGRIYSVMSIIRKVCENTLKGVNADVRGFAVDGEKKVSNKFIQAFIGDKWIQDATLANIRSEMVKNAINTLTISGSLNPNVLKGL